MQLDNFINFKSQRRLIKAITLVFALLLIVVLPSCKSHSKHSTESGTEELTDSEIDDLTEKLNKIEQYWVNIQNQYQRRIDLYKNITKTVKAVAEHEHSTQKDVVEARARALQKINAVEATADSMSKVKIDPNDAEALNDYAQAQHRLSEQMYIAINVVHEAYPGLKVNENFLSLQAQIEGTENRITVACNDYNSYVIVFNNAIKKYGKERASNSNFKEKPLFLRQEGADKAPDIDL